MSLGSSVHLKKTQRVTGFLFFDAAGRGQPFPSHRFVFVNMAGRVSPSLSYRFMFFDAAGRGQPSPSRQFTFVNMAGREKPSLSYWFAFFDAAGREEPSIVSIRV